jgi:hypothetical protein
VHEELDSLGHAAHAAADVVEARTSGDFLEATLEAALAAALPGETPLDQQRRPMPLPGWDEGLQGVDITWRRDEAAPLVGVEVKVTDVYDVLSTSSSFDRGRPPNSFVLSPAKE